MGPPHMSMKIQTLLPTLAALMFVVTASAQSDPSTGGSFAAMPRTSGTVRMTQDRAITTSTRTQVQSQPTFWNRLTGRNSSMSLGRDRHPASTHGWFAPNHGANSKPAPAHRSWFGLHHNPPMVQTRMTRVNTTTSPRSNGWHLPFFSRR